MCSRVDMLKHTGGPSSFRVRDNCNPKLRLGFDLLTSGSMHAEVLPCTICLPTLVLIAQAVFLLKHRQTEKDRRN